MQQINQNKDILMKYQAIREKSQINELENDIESVMRATQALYWSISKSKDRKNEINPDFLHILKIANDYVKLSYNELSSAQVLNNKKKHIIYQPEERVEGVMKKAAAIIPFVSLSELQKSWNLLIETPGKKVLFTFLGSVLSLLFGTASILHWVFVTLTVAHFISRHWANKHRQQNDYITFNKSIQYFILPYFWLVIGTQISYIVSLDGLPEGTLHAILIVWLIWGELKGTVENMKAAKFPIPPILEKLVRTNNQDIDPPM